MPVCDVQVPVFLQQTQSDIHNKFIDLEWQQRHRIAAGSHRARNDDEPSPWARVDHAEHPEVPRRNRYINVEPFASNRVRLRVPEGVPDYINASPIMLKQTVSGTEKHYIAAQGPRAETIGHLWRMIMGETGEDPNPAVIVMLTQTYESGREKCSQYYPLDWEHPVVSVVENDGTGDGFAALLTLKGIREDTATRSTLREIEVCAEPIDDGGGQIGLQRTAGETSDGVPQAPGKCRKTAQHLLFSGWPDFAVPEGASRAALVQLVALSNRLNMESSNPLIVHCSAGVGRSGTFIALDYLLREIAEGAWDDVASFDDPTRSNGSTEPQTPFTEDPGTVDSFFAAQSATVSGTGRSSSARDSMVLTDAGRAKDPILDVVDSLRRQRMMMVQGVAQFEFLYDVCREAWVERRRGLIDSHQLRAEGHDEVG